MRCYDSLYVLGLKVVFIQMYMSICNSSLSCKAQANNVCGGLVNTFGHCNSISVFLQDLNALKYIIFLTHKV